VDVNELTDCPSCGGKVALEYSNRCQHCGHMFAQEMARDTTSNSTWNDGVTWSDSPGHYNPQDHVREPSTYAGHRIYNQDDYYEDDESTFSGVLSVLRHWQLILGAIILFAIVFDECGDDYDDGTSVTGVYIRSGSNGSRTGKTGGFGFGK